MGIGVLAVLLSVMWYFLFEHGEKKDPVLKILPENVDLQVKDVHYTEVGDPESTWDIRAESARYIKKENLALFDKVIIKLAKADGREFTMQGDTGRMNTETKDAEINGNVVLTSNRGDRITTDRVFYSGAEKKAYTDQAIKLTRPGLELSGKGLIFYVENQHVMLNSEIKAVVTRQ